MVAAELAELSEAERYAYDYFVKRIRTGGSSTYPLAPDLQDGLFRLYLQGLTFSDLQRRNPTLGLGQIVYAAVDGGWSARRRSYRDDLLIRAQQRVIDSVTEGVQFVAEAMAGAHLAMGEEVRRYLQTGQDPPPYLKSFGNYERMVRALLTLTGRANEVRPVEPVRVVPAAPAIDVSARPVQKQLDVHRSTLAEWARETAVREKPGKFDS